MHDELQPPPQPEAPEQGAIFSDEPAPDDRDWAQAESSFGDVDALYAPPGAVHAALSSDRSAAEPRMGQMRHRPSADHLEAASAPVPPADLLAERAILASCLADIHAVASAADKVRPQDFYDKRHEAVFAAIVELANAARGTDVVSVMGQLELNGTASRVGFPYLLELVSHVGSTLSVEHYATRVAKLASVQRILSAAHTVQAEGYKRGVDPDAFVQLVESELGKALEATVRGGAVPVGDLALPVFEEILRVRERGHEVTGIPTGFRDLDAKTQGLHATDLFILAARPAMGKTALALNLALQVALARRHDATSPQDRHTVLVFSLEMGRDQLVQRLLSAHSRVGLTLIRTGRINHEEEAELRRSASEISDLSLHIDDTPGLSITELRARAKRIQMQHGIDLIVVDYLQLMKGTGARGQSREQEISEISRGLKGLAKELHCAVMALSQLNRSVETRGGDKRPQLADLRESGAIEQDADIIAFVFRENYYNQDAPEHVAELIIAKQRAGPTGTVGLHFDGPLTKFSNLDNRIDDHFAGY